MPGLYQPGTYDLAGTIIGVVEEDEALHGDAIVPGDVLLGLRLDRAAHQRLHARPPDRVRADGPRAGRHAGRTGTVRRGRAAGGASELRSERAAGDRSDARARAHHRRRHPRQPRPHTAGGMRGDGGSRHVGACRRSSPRCSRRGGSRPSEMRDVFNLGVGLIAVLPADAVGRGAGRGDARPASPPGRWARSVEGGAPCGSPAPDGAILMAIRSGLLALAGMLSAFRAARASPRMRRLQR